MNAPTTTDVQPRQPRSRGLLYSALGAGLGVSLLLSACNSDDKPQAAAASAPAASAVTEPAVAHSDASKPAAAEAAATDSIYAKNGLNVRPAPAATAYPGATIRLKQPQSGAVVNGQSVPFVFEIENYELGIETPDAASKGLANSGMGQHIHLIVDDGAYSAHYNTEFAEKIATPGHHLGIAFLSRSYHESVKEPGAYQVFEFTTGEDGVSASESVDLAAPMLFYSRPKGDYTGKETGEVLLDFYLVNTELSEDGNQVEVTINDTDTFRITRWAPYVIEGLPLGKHTIAIELVDANGNPLPSPLGGGKQTITLKESGSAAGAATGAASHGHGH